jgi:hypothetical protein
MSTKNLNVSYITDEKGNKTHIILPIELYEDIQLLKSLITSQSDNNSELYTLTSNRIIANGYPTGNRNNPAFVVIAGSFARKEVATSLRKPVIDMRNKLIEKGILSFNEEHNCYVFTENYVFSSSSFAASLVAGNTRNGLDAWISNAGFSLKNSGYGNKNEQKNTSEELLEE